jgi:hypothetical protein
MIAESAKSARLCACWGLCVALFLFNAPATCYGEDITIDVAPNTLNLQSEGKVVTVHTDIAYWVVDVSSVYINGIAIASWKADNRGNFVAKFSMDEVKNLDGLIIDGYNTLQLVGLTTGGEPFWGELDILVIDEGSSGP